MRLFSLSLLVAVSILAVPAKAQTVVEPPEPRASPTSIAQATIGDTYVKVTYSAPRKRDRVIFGELVPFGEVWRTGANEATEVYFSSDVFVGNTRLKSGMYSLFTIPSAEIWTVILNRELGLWGAFQYDASQDAARLELPTTPLEEQVYEAFTISIDDNQAPMGGGITLSWDQTSVRIPFRVLAP